MAPPIKATLLAALAALAVSSLVYFLWPSGSLEQQKVVQINIKVDSKGGFSIDGQSYDLTGLEAELLRVKESSDNVSVLILTSQQSRHEVVGRAVVAAQKARIAHVRLIAEPPS
jgi:biopolymer transport protein ExbD